MMLYLNRVNEALRKALMNRKVKSKIYFYSYVMIISFGKTYCTKTEVLNTVTKNRIQF